MTRKLKTNKISAAGKKTRCLQHFGVCLATCSRRVGTAMLNDLAPEYSLFVFLLIPEMVSLHGEGEQREQGRLRGNKFL